MNKTFNWFSVLEFLNTKAKVIHGDVSISNIMINRIWTHGPNDSPTQLRALATARADSMSQTDLASDAFSDTEANSDESLSSVQTPIYPLSPVVGPAAVSVPVIQGAAPALARVSDCVNHAGTLEFIESSGMLIDCDFMRYIHQDTHQTSVSGQTVMLSHILLTFLC